MATIQHDVPGINLDWLNVDTDQGMEIETGRKGLTLGDNQPAHLRR